MSGSTDALSDLDVDNQEQLVKYLKFFKSKRDQAVSQLDSDFDDTKNDRLLEDMYSRDEVEGMLEHLNVVTKDNMRQEVQNILSMNVLLIKQVLERASQQRAEVKLDMGAIEDQAMLDAVDKIRLDQPRQVADAKPARRNSALSSMKDDSAALVAEKNRLEDSNNTLQQRFTQMQTQMSAVLKQKSELQEELSRLRDQLDSERADYQAQAKHASETISAERSAKEAVRDMSESSSSELQRALSDARQQISELEADMEAKLTSSKQFQQMKTMMSQKSQKVNDLRRRLQKYEPDALAEDD